MVNYNQISLQLNVRTLLRLRRYKQLLLLMNLLYKQRIQSIAVFEKSFSFGVS